MQNYKMSTRINILHRLVLCLILNSAYFFLLWLMKVLGLSDAWLQPLFAIPFFISFRIGFSIFQWFVIQVVVTGFVLALSNKVRKILAVALLWVVANALFYFLLLV